MRGAGLPQAARCMGLRLAAASRRAGLLRSAGCMLLLCGLVRCSKWPVAVRFGGRSAGFEVRRHVRALWDRSTDGAAVSPVSLGLAKDAYGAVVRGVMLAITVEEEDGSSSCAREKKPRINYAPQHIHNLRRYIISTRHIELTACVELYINAI